MYDDVTLSSTLASLPGHPQIYLAVLHSCEIESGGGLGTKLMRPLPEHVSIILYLFVPPALIVYMVLNYVCYFYFCTYAFYYTQLCE